MATERIIDAMLEDAQLTLDELCRATRTSPTWVIERVREGLLTSCEGEPTAWRFDAITLRRARRIAQLERDFDAVPELAALVADLQDEIERLRLRVRRAGLG